MKNLGAPTNIRWNRFDEDGRVQALLDKYGFQSIFFPEILIAPEDKEKILSEYIQFGEAIASDWIPFSTKRRLTKCLKDATQALGSTGYIPYHPSYIPEEVTAGAHRSCISRTSSCWYRADGRIRTKGTRVNTNHLIKEWLASISQSLVPRSPGLLTRLELSAAGHCALGVFGGVGGFGI